MLAINYALFLIVIPRGTASRCEDHACSPPLGNLASGRRLHTLSASYGNISQDTLCPSPHHACSEQLHPPAHMVDDPFLHPDTWWRSRASAEQQDEILLELETKFILTHVFLLFHSPRPAAMALDRSQDYGQTWETLKLFAQNCMLEFGLPDDSRQAGSLCTSRYSGATTCSRGEVIYRALGPGDGGLVDPYSPEALIQLSLTSLRIRLIKAQPCQSSSSSSSPSVGPPNTLTAGSASPSISESSAEPLFSIYTLLAGGTCLCHGHAEQCVPHNSSQETPEDGSMVSGRCVCTHHTAGEHCERCAPLYNDRAWRPANGSSGEPHPCQKCECHGHADSCRFSKRAWLSSGGRGGGVCHNCRHNTAGRKCQRCRHGYHRNPTVPLDSPYACIRCRCDPVGSSAGQSELKGPWCHSRSGQCPCKPGVGGTSCSHCLPGYWEYGEEGCRPCACPLSCDPFTGHCLDRNNQVFNVPIGGKIPDVDLLMTNEGKASWSKELAISALHYTGKCNCKERKLTVSDLCKTKHDYVIKASVLSAHDKGSHAEVQVKVRKVLRSGQVTLSQGTLSLYPLPWTSRGCTCPILNPGVEYLLAGPEEAGTGRLLVTMQSVVVPWTPQLGVHIAEGLRHTCP